MFRFFNYKIRNSCDLIHVVTSWIEISFFIKNHLIFAWVLETQSCHVFDCRQIEAVRASLEKNQDQETLEANLYDPQETPKRRLRRRQGEENEAFEEDEEADGTKKTKRRVKKKKETEERWGDPTAFQEMNFLIVRLSPKLLQFEWQKKNI